MAKKKRYPSLGRKGSGTKRYVMKGGPLNGTALWLSCPGTLPFSLRGERGRYNHNNEWESMLTFADMVGL